MAQRVNIVLIDDVDGSTAEETVTFALDGITYEIDLSADNAKKLRTQLGEWADKARTTGRGRGRGTQKSTGRAARRNSSDLRQWARDNGYEVSDRGRVPAEVKAAYEAATK